MKGTIDLAIVIPLGPGCLQENIEDTIDSVIHHTKCTYKIILVDDSQHLMGTKIQQFYPEVDVVTTPEPMGKLCGLYVTLCLAFRYLNANYNFKGVLRMDTDALIIAQDPEKMAFDFFTAHPEAGIAGQYPLDYNGNPWDISWPAGQIKRFTKTWRFFKHPLAHLQLVKILKRARKNGYINGESVFGGAYILSAAFLKALSTLHMLPDMRMKKIYLEEDHLIAIMAKSAGFSFVDMSAKDKPFACAWKGLPASPVVLARSGKKIIHSVRFWNHISEKDIRFYFRRIRLQEKMANINLLQSNQDHKTWFNQKPC